MEAELTHRYFSVPAGKRLLHVPGYRVQVVETTGCGDSVMGTVLAELAGYSVDEIGELPLEKLEPVMKLANAVAADRCHSFRSGRCEPDQSGYRAIS